MSTKMSAALAEAIGHTHVMIGGPRGHVHAYVTVPDAKHHGFGMMRPFDLNDPAVIWPIAKRYRCFPHEHPLKPGCWRAYRDGALYSGTGKTPEEAVAAAVIAMHAACEL